MNAEPVVRVEGLHYDWGRGPLLQALDFEVASHEIFGIVGADGAGKSTLLQLLIGQLRPRAGRILVLGRPPGTPGLRDALAYMPQAFGQYLDLSVLENLRFFASLHGLPGDEAARMIADLLARTGLAGFESRRAGQLSGGMMQKLALACALVSRPRAMFLDEPTTGVDPLSRRAFWQLLDGVRAEGVAIVCTTANMEEAERCDRVATLEDGRFTRVGRPQDLVRAVQATLCTVVGDDARGLQARATALPEVEMAFAVGRELRLWLRAGVAPASVQARLAAGRAELVLQPRVPRLHDVALRELALSSAGGERA